MSTDVLNSRKLSYFREVAWAGSFRLAALRVGVSQSVLTRQVQSLEEELGVVLFQRGGSETRTTEAGELLLERCEKILSELEDTRALLSSRSPTPQGTTTVAMLTSFSTNFSVDILNRARECMPNVRLRMTEGSSRYVEERVLSGQADIGVLIKRPLSDRFIFEELLHEDFWIFGRSFPDNRKRWTFKDIAALPLVLPLPPHGGRRLIDEAARREGTVLQAGFEVDSPYLIRDLILTRDMYAILPRISLRSERLAGSIRAAPIVNPPMVTLAIGSLKGKPLSTAARVLANCIRKTVEAAPLLSEDCSRSAAEARVS